MVMVSTVAGNREQTMKMSQQVEDCQDWRSHWEVARQANPCKKIDSKLMDVLNIDIPVKKPRNSMLIAAIPRDNPTVISLSLAQQSSSSKSKGKLAVTLESLDQSARMRTIILARRVRNLAGTRESGEKELVLDIVANL